MAAEIPTNEPTELRAGDTWKWTRTLADYPAGTWTLKYRFKNAAGGFEITASASGTDHAVTQAATSTNTYAAGTYQWIAWVEAGAEKFTVDTGTLKVLPDYRSGTAAAALDDRSHARKVLAALEARIEGRDMDVGELEIAGRRIKYLPIADVIKFHNRYKALVDAEVNAELIAKGEGVGRKIQFRI